MEDEDGIVVITLTSATIFWSELGLKHGTAAEREVSAKIFDDEIEPWLSENIKGPFNPHVDGVWFCEQADAALFRLMFHEKYL